MHCTSECAISDQNVLIRPGVNVAEVECRVDEPDEVEQVLQSLTVL